MQTFQKNYLSPTIFGLTWKLFFTWKNSFSFVIKNPTKLIELLFDSFHVKNGFNLLIFICIPDLLLRKKTGKHRLVFNQEEQLSLEMSERVWRIVEWQRCIRIVYEGGKDFGKQLKEMKKYNKKDSSILNRHQVAFLKAMFSYSVSSSHGWFLLCILVSKIIIIIIMLIVV